MKQWYLETPQPTFNGGFENDEWGDYAIDGFDEALTDTTLSDTVKLCSGVYNGETGLFATEFETKAIIQNKTPDAYTQGWVRQILTRMSDNLSNYQYVKYTDTGTNNSQIFLIETMPASNKIYTKAVIHECNYTLKWQDDTGVVHYQPSVTQEATQYSTGIETARNIINTPYTQYMSWLPITNDTLNINRDKRMFIDLNTQTPLVFKVTSTSRIPYSYNERRMLRVTFTEDLYNAETDSIENWLCDYIQPPPRQAQIIYAGNPEIRIGGRKTFTCNVASSFNIVVSPEWQDKIHLYVESETKCYITADLNADMVGASVRLNADNSQGSDYVIVNIIGAV